MEETTEQKPQILPEEAMKEEAQDAPWESNQYEAALAHLERIQGQLDNLRSTIPSIVSPLLRQQQTKAQMFVAIKKAAVQSTDDVKAFRESWNGAKTQKLLRVAKASLETNADLQGAQGMQGYGWSETQSESDGAK